MLRNDELDLSSLMKSLSEIAEQLEARARALEQDAIERNGERLNEGRPQIRSELRKNLHRAIVRFKNLRCLTFAMILNASAVDKWLRNHKELTGKRNLDSAGKIDPPVEVTLEIFGDRYRFHIRGGLPLSYNIIHCIVGWLVTASSVVEMLSYSFCLLSKDINPKGKDRNIQLLRERMATNVIVNDFLNNLGVNSEEGSPRWYNWIFELRDEVLHGGSYNDLYASIDDISDFLASDGIDVLEVKAPPALRDKWEVSGKRFTDIFNSCIGLNEDGFHTGITGILTRTLPLLRDTLTEPGLGFPLEP